jgi:poly-gamma-glutamate synthase PgsB/CapB
MNLASKLGADTLVSELMSIGEECLAAESGRIIRPGILALTNVKLDHLDEMGHSKEDIARTLSSAFPQGGMVFVPREEVYPVFEERASRLGIRMIPVEGPPGREDDIPVRDANPEVQEEGSSGPAFPREFEPNHRLAYEILTSLGLSRNEALRGMSRARPDFGSLRIWSTRLVNPARLTYFVNAFAANDPESTSVVMEEIKVILSLDSRSLFGILCLREDRGDRTMQWIRAAEEGFFAGFERVAVLGAPARAALVQLRRKLGPGGGKFFRPSDPAPETAVTRLASAAQRESVVIGLGNIVGAGERIIRYWEKKGAPHAR